LGINKQKNKMTYSQHPKGRGILERDTKQKGI